jgi:Mg2+ and Co2+ transporter CorA
MVSETVFTSYKEAVERLEKEKKELEKQVKNEQQKTDFAIKELEKIKLEKIVLKKENEALEEKLVDQAIGTLRELEKRRKFEGKVSAADELPQDWKQKFWTLPRQTRVRLEAEALKKLDSAQRKIPRLAEYYTQNVLLPKILKEKKIFIPTKKEQKRIEETELRARKQQLCTLFDKLKWTTERIKIIEQELLENDN